MDSELRAKLKELHQSLQQVDSLDEEALQLLAAVADDLHRLSIQPQALTAEHISPVSTQLKELALRFESHHPQLTVLLGRITESLANLGI
jgi:Domain of unknown function (DUF4404)